jgi:hypothetical protein
MQFFDHLPYRPLSSERQVLVKCLVASYLSLPRFSLLISAFIPKTAMSQTTVVDSALIKVSHRYPRRYPGLECPLTLTYQAPPRPSAGDTEDKPVALEPRLARVDNKQISAKELQRHRFSIAVKSATYFPSANGCCCAVVLETSFELTGDKLRKLVRYSSDGSVSRASFRYCECAFEREHQPQTRCVQ